MSQPTSIAGLGVPLSSNNKANPYTVLGGSGSSLAGVTSLNGQSGNLAIVGDTSIGVSAIGSGQLQVSTTGKPQNVGAITAPSATVSGAVAAGTVSATSAALSGTLTANAVQVTTLVSAAQASITGATTSLSFAVPSSTSLTLTNPTTLAVENQPIKSFIAPAVIAIPAMANGATYTVTEMATYLTQPGFHTLAYSYNLPYVDQTNLANTAAGACGMILVRCFGNSGGAQAPLIASQPFTNVGTTLSFVGTGVGVPPYSMVLTASGGATQAGILSICQLN